MQSLILVVSDLHLGKGRFLESGQYNILEDFEEDDRFVEFLEYFSTQEYEEASVHLVLNGDIFNLIQIDLHGVFSSQWTETKTVQALEKIIQGHPRFFLGLRAFLQKPAKKITYVIGNHDAGMYWQLPQNKLREIIGEGIEFVMDMQIHGVHIEHGHRFESMNAMPLSQYFTQGPTGEQILNLPWGSRFCIEILPRLKKERPLIDRVRPMSAYVKWCLIHDLYFFVRMSMIITKFVIESIVHNPRRIKGQWKGILIMLKQLSIYPKYAKQAKQILRKNPDIHTVIMGHTHLKEWRRFPQEKYYFNTGTWNHIPSMDSGLHPDETQLTFVAVLIDPEKSRPLNTAMNIWQGRWRPFRENISLDSGQALPPKHVAG